MDAPALSDSAEGQIVVEKRAVPGQIRDRGVRDEQQERRRRVTTTENPTEEEKSSPEVLAPAESSISEEVAEGDAPSLDEAIEMEEEGAATERPFELSRLQESATSGTTWMGLQNRVRDVIRRIPSIGGRRIELNGVRIQRAAPAIVAGGIVLLVAFLLRRRSTSEEPPPSTGPASAIAHDYM